MYEQLPVVGKSRVYNVNDILIIRDDRVSGITLFLTIWWQEVWLGSPRRAPLRRPIKCQLYASNSIMVVVVRAVPITMDYLLI